MAQNTSSGNSKPATIKNPAFKQYHGGGNTRGPKRSDNPMGQNGGVQTSKSENARVPSVTKAPQK